MAQSDDTVRGLRMLYGTTPLVVAALGALLIARYPLTRGVHAQVRAQLDAREPEDR